MWPVVSDPKDKLRASKGPQGEQLQRKAGAANPICLWAADWRESEDLRSSASVTLQIYCQLEDSDKRGWKVTTNIVGVKTILVPSWAWLSHDFPTKKLCIRSSYHLLSGHRKSSTSKALSYQALSTALWMDSIVLWYRKSKTIGAPISDTAFNITEKLEWRPDHCSKGAPFRCSNTTGFSVWRSRLERVAREFHPSWEEPWTKEMDTQALTSCSRTMAG